MKEFIKLEDPRKYYNGLHDAKLEPKDISTGGGVTVLGKGDLSLQSVGEWSVFRGFRDRDASTEKADKYRKFGMQIHCEYSVCLFVLSAYLCLFFFRVGIIYSLIIPLPPLLLAQLE